MGHQLRTREHLFRRRGEERQELELPRRQVDLDAVDEDLASAGVDREAVEHVLRNPGSLHSGSSENCMEARHELSRRKRFDHVVVGARVDHVERFGRGRLAWQHRDGRHARVLS